VHITLPLSTDVKKFLRTPGNRSGNRAVMEWPVKSQFVREDVKGFKLRSTGRQCGQPEVQGESVVNRKYRATV